MPAEPDPDWTVDGLGCTNRDLDTYLDWAGAQPAAEPRGPEED